MTRQHFRALADAIRNASLSHDDRRRVAGAVASAVAQFNPRFDRDKFLLAAISGGTYQAARGGPTVRTRPPSGSCDLVTDASGEEVWRLVCGSCGTVGDFPVKPFPGPDAPEDIAWRDHLKEIHP